MEFNVNTPPPMTDPYQDWRKELNIWSRYVERKGTPIDQQGMALFLTLKGMPRHLVSEQMEIEDIDSKEGFQRILRILDKKHDYAETKKREECLNIIQDFMRNPTNTQETVHSPDSLFDMNDDYSDCSSPGSFKRLNYSDYQTPKYTYGQQTTNNNFINPHTSNACMHSAEQSLPVLTPQSQTSSFRPVLTEVSPNLQNLAASSFSSKPPPEPQLFSTPPPNKTTMAPSPSPTQSPHMQNEENYNFYKYFEIPTFPDWVVQEINSVQQKERSTISSQCKALIMNALCTKITVHETRPCSSDLALVCEKLVLKYPALADPEKYAKQSAQTWTEDLRQKIYDLKLNRESKTNKRRRIVCSTPEDVDSYNNAMKELQTQAEAQLPSKKTVEEQIAKSFCGRREKVKTDKTYDADKMLIDFPIFKTCFGLKVECEVLLQRRLPDDVKSSFNDSRAQRVLKEIDGKIPPETEKLQKKLLNISNEPEHCAIKIICALPSLTKEKYCLIREDVDHACDDMYPHVYLDYKQKNFSLFINETKILTVEYLLEAVQACLMAYWVFDIKHPVPGKRMLCLLSAMMDLFHSKHKVSTSTLKYLKKIVW